MLNGLPSEVVKYVLAACAVEIGPVRIAAGVDDPGPTDVITLTEPASIRLDDKEFVTVAD